jgi:hypothetical protein
MPCNPNFESFELPVIRPQFPATVGEPPPLHLTLADTPWPHGPDATLANDLLRDCAYSQHGGFRVPLIGVNNTAGA